jgi:hypothetical protein
MATDILDVYKSVYADGPSSSPVQPDKGRIRDEIGGGLQAIIDALRALFGLSVQWKGAVRAGSTSNVNLATIANGASFGGVTVATGNRIVAMGQSTASQNGIYVVQASGAPVRSTDADAGTEVAGMAFYVSEGTEGGRSFLCNTPGPITLGSTALSFVMIADQVALNAAIAALQTLGLSGAIPANYEGIVYKLFGPGNAAALTSQGFWHNLVDVVAPRGEVLTDQVIDGKLYSIAVTDNSGQILMCIADGLVEFPGIIDMIGSDDTYAGGLGFKDGTPVILARRDGMRSHVRGWEASTTLPTIFHIPFLGQSNSKGAQPVITTTDQKFGALMPRRGIHTWQEEELTYPLLGNRGTGSFELIPHREQTNLAVGETWASGLTAQLKVVGGGGRFAAQDLTQTAPHLVFTNPDRGARWLRDLGPAGPYGHFSTSVNDVTRIREQANSLGFDYAVGAMVFCEGESESAGQMNEGGPVLGYNALLTAYKSEIAYFWSQSDVEFRLQSGQIDNHSRRIPMFIVQTVSNWTGEAQRQVAQEYSELMVACPMYFGPSEINIEWSYVSPADNNTYTDRGATVHNTPDMYRWLGEQIGKVMRRVLIQGERWRPLEPTDAARENNTTIRVKFNVPRPPLRWSSDFNIGIPDHPTKGFQVFLGTPNAPGAARTISSVEIFDPDVVQITLDASTPVAAGQAVYVVYGNDNFVRSTSGNVVTVRSGAAYPNGQASNEILFAGDVRGQFSDMLVEGAFFLYQGGAYQLVQDVRFEGGQTICRGEARIHDGDIVTGQVAQIRRDRNFGNLVDSDNAQSHYTFAGAYGTRQGRFYPLNNFCLVSNQTVRT